MQMYPSIEDFAKGPQTRTFSILNLHREYLGTHEFTLCLKSY